MTDGLFWKFFVKISRTNHNRRTEEQKNRKSIAAAPCSNTFSVLNSSVFLFFGSALFRKFFKRIFGTERYRSFVNN